MLLPRIAILAFIAIGASFFASTEAAAQSGELLIRQGVEARKAGRDQEAFGLFKQAYEILHSPRSAAQLGLCERALLDFLNASAHLTEAMAAKSDVWVSSNRRTLAMALKDTQAHLVSVSVTGSPVGASVFVNETPAGKLPTVAATYVLPGKITINVKAPGHTELSEDYTRAAGETLEVLADLRPTQLEIARTPEMRAPEEVTLLAPAPLPEGQDHGSSKMRMAGLVTGAVGVACLLGAGYYALEVGSLSAEARDADIFDPRRIDRLDAAEARQYVFLSAGAVALLVGGILYWVGEK